MPKRTNTTIDPALAPLVAIVARSVLATLAANGAGDAGDPWIDQITSPLGRRVHVRLCREGRIAGARKVAKRWLVRRSALDRYIEGHAPPADLRGGEGSDVDTVLAELGLERVGGRR